MLQLPSMSSDAHESLYRLLIDNMPEYVVISRHGRLEFISRSVTTKLGYHPEEVIGHSLIEYIPPEFHPQVLDNLRRRAAGQPVDDIEAQIVTACGSRRDVIIQPRLLDQGDPLVTLSVLVDITERKQFERGLEQRDRILRSISLAAETLLMTNDWQKWMPEVLRQIGEAAHASRVHIFENITSSREEVITSQRYEWSADGIQPMLVNPMLQNVPMFASGLERWVRLMQAGWPVHSRVDELPHSERPLLEKQGIVSIYVEPMFVDGSWWGFIGFDECTGERDWSQPEVEALHTAASLFSAAIQRQRYTEHQHQLEQRREILYQATWEIGLSMNYAHIAAALAKAMKQVMPVERVLLALAMNQDPEQKFDYRYSSDYYSSDTGETATPGQAQIWSLNIPLKIGDHLVGMMQVQTSSPLQDSPVDQDMLKMLAAFGATACENARLIEEERKAQEEATAANRSKSIFLANMSHEIRTPLNAVIGMTSLLLNTPLSPTQQEFAQTIRTSGSNLLALINDILDLSRIEAGKLELEQQPFSLRSIIEECLDLQAAHAMEKGLELAHWIDPGIPDFVIGDAARLRQVLVNLVGNAVKFTPSGSVGVGLNCLQQNLEANTYQFQVIDTGIGISRDKVKRLFQMFSQGDASTTRRYGGSGLGLAISKRLVEMMGGTIRVNSKPELGSIFTFTIVVPPAAGGLQAQEVGLSRVKVLAVSSHPLVQYSLANLAFRQRMSLKVLPQPDLALEELQDGIVYNLLIVDAQVTSQEARNFAERLRQLPIRHRPKFVLLSPLSHVDLPRDQVFYDALLFKPLKLDTLRNTVSRLFLESGPILPKKEEPERLGASDRPMGTLRILLAEDNVVNQQVTLRMLEGLGYRADIAANGLEVLQALLRQPYDIILMDLHMPEMDGLQATARIRADYPPQNQPHIIALTASVLPEDIEACRACGMNGFVAKPVFPAELERALLACTEERGERSQPAAFEKVAMPKGSISQDAAAGPFPVLDRQTLSELEKSIGKDSEQGLDGLLQLYLARTPDTLNEMVRSLAGEDLYWLARSAHTLKSSSAALGARQLAAKCQELELQARASSRSGVIEMKKRDWGANRRVFEVLVAQVELEFSRLRKEIQSFLDERRGTTTTGSGLEPSFSLQQEDLDRLVSRLEPEERQDLLKSIRSGDIERMVLFGRQLQTRPDLAALGGYIVLLASNLEMGELEKLAVHLTG